jgi:hypothetical protein
MNEIVEASEQITRFLMHSSEFRAVQCRVSYSAFMPDKRGEKSVYRTTDLSAEQIRAIGREHVEPVRGPIKGEGRVLAEIIFDRGLTIEAAPKPHPRHANILGYRDRAADRIAAQKIADHAKLVLYVANSLKPR